MTIGKPILKCGLVLVQNQVDPKTSIAEEIVWREVSGHSTELMGNRYTTQRPSLRGETEKVSKNRGSSGGHSWGHFREGQEVNFLYRALPTLTFFTFPVWTMLSTLKLNENKSKFCVHMNNKGAKGNSVEKE